MIELSTLVPLMQAYFMAGLVGVTWLLISVLKLG
jgi:hypothetical protein